jgi:hypothetical protein
LTPVLADRPRTALEVAELIAELSGLDAVAESAVGDRTRARDHRGPLNVVREV